MIAKKAKQETVQLKLRLPKQLAHLLKILAQIEERSINNLITRALREEVKKLTEPAKEPT
jgi:predicted HicB family RNase H-like nuclease